MFANLSNFFRFSNLLFYSNHYVLLVPRYPDTSFVGVDSITFPSMGATGGQYVENTPEISKNQGFANFKFLFYCSNPLFS